MTSRNLEIGKVPAAFLLAALTTMTLFYLMQQLVNTEFEMPDQKEGIELVSINIPDKPLEVVRKTLMPEKIEEVEIVEVIDTVIDDPTLATDRFGFGKVEAPPIEPTEINLSVNEGSAMVLRQVNPVYPTSALTRGIEGFVVLEFTVNPVGMVENPRVIYSEPEGVFDRAALAAIERWRFKPKVVNGKEVPQPGERRRIAFNIED